MRVLPTYPGALSAYLKDTACGRRLEKPNGKQEAIDGRLSLRYQFVRVLAGSAAYCKRLWQCEVVRALAVECRGCRWNLASYLLSFSPQILSSIF